MKSSPKPAKRGAPPKPFMPGNPGGPGRPPMSPAERLLARAERRVVADLKNEIAPLVSLAIDKLEEVLQSPGVDATTMTAIKETLDRFAGRSVAHVSADVRNDSPVVLLSDQRLDALLQQAAARRAAVGSKTC